ncbi:MAG: 8-amino-7-oxononanoate synthase [Nitrospirae bacterium]|nr:8-amino-7-oxononanoate synthase [Nitrospirota bacterium]
MFYEKLRILKEKSLFRTIKDRESTQGPRIKFNNVEYINFSSNDYLGLTNHPIIIEAVRHFLYIYGYGAGASRLLSGGSILHKELEKNIALFKETESALLFNSGYAANIGIIPAITDENTVILSDQLNHASIIDGCRLSKSNTLIYKHKDISHAEELLRTAGKKKKIIATDSVFSMDGDIAPIKELCTLCQKYEAFLYIDDAHATGVLGKGKGSLAHFNIKPDPWIIQMGTFSKAFGSYGAFLVGSENIIQWVTNNARSFIYSTALPSCVIAASIAALKFIENNPAIIEKLWINRNKVANRLQQMGYDIMGSETPIIPLKTGSIENTIRISSHLFNLGIYAPAIRPPTVQEPRIRITITAAHTDEDIERFIEALVKIRV